MVGHLELERIRADAPRALELAVRFAVSTKEWKGAAWIDRLVGLSDLLDALKRAQEMPAFEVAVFAAGKSNGSFVYWSSKNPETFNSTVLDLAASPD